MARITDTGNVSYHAMLTPSPVLTPFLEELAEQSALMWADMNRGLLAAFNAQREYAEATPAERRRIDTIRRLRDAERRDRVKRHAIDQLLASPVSEVPDVVLDALGAGDEWRDAEQDEVLRMWEQG